MSYQDIDSRVRCRFWMQHQMQILTATSNADCDSSIRSRFWQQLQMHFLTATSEADSDRSVRNIFRKKHYMKILTAASDANSDSIARCRLWQHCPMQILPPALFADFILIWHMVSECTLVSVVKDSKLVPKIYIFHQVRAYHEKNVRETFEFLCSTDFWLWPCKVIFFLQIFVF